MGFASRSTHASLSALFSLLAFGSCTLSRPEGAFNPVYQEGKPLDPDFSEGDGDVAEPGGDGDLFGNGDGDMPTEVQDPRLANLVGTYLARFDELSSNTTDLGTPVGDVTTHSRISRFFIIDIKARDGGIASTEHMCGQVHTQECARCEESSTVIDSKAAAKLRSTPAITHMLTLDEDGVLHAPIGKTYLGYDVTASDTGLPNSNTDPRVWDITSSSGREGLYTRLKMSIDLGGILGSSGATCDISFVQQLHLGWDIKVKKGDVYELQGPRGEFTVKGTGDNSRILDARANPTDKQEECMGNGPSGDDIPIDNVVTFVRTELNKCPSNSMFEAMLPGEPLPGN